MKTNKFNKLLCLLLAVFTILSMVSCNKDPEKEQPTEAPTEEETEEETVAQTPYPFSLTEEYVIVRGDLYSSNEEITDACFYLKKAIEKAYGITLNIVTDQTDAKGKKEFLIGATNRAVSKRLSESLGLNDYAYYVPSQSSIVICGGTPELTLEAVEKFCQDILTYDGKKVQTKKAAITTLTKYSFTDAYDYTSLTLNGILWEDYTLVVSSSNDIPGAVELNKQIGQYTGQILPILHVSEMTGDEESIIRVGASYRDGKSSNNLNGYMINSYKDEAGNVICIDASSKKYYVDVVKALLDNADKKIDGTAISYQFEQETLYSVTTMNRDDTNAKNDFMHWELSSEKTEEISDGVTYTEQLYYDDAGLPYRVYTLVVDINKNTITMGTGNDGYAYPLTDTSLRQNTQEHMQAAVANGKNVIAGINADFFDNIASSTTAGDYRPWGLTIKDGKVLNTPDTLKLRPILHGTTGNVRPFFGFTKEGTPVIAMESEYATAASLATLDTAVGGAYILCEEGGINFFKYQHNIIHGEVHPRTVVGYREDGTVVMMVIDGRQVKHSNGASILQCSLLMQRFGASDALLLDGGGSSDMVLRDPDTNKYTTANKPSDGSDQGQNNLRDMYNSLLVVKK